MRTSRFGRPGLAALLALLTSACDRPARQSQLAPPDAAPVSTPGPTASSGPASPLAEGAHDYRGDVGGTPVAMHLVRAGSAVSGSYVYRSIGHAIALAGTIDGAGNVALTETVKGRSTGTFALRRDASDTLQGRWSDPAAAKTLDVRVSPGDPWGGASRRAEECLADPRCTAAEASRLFLVADDDHESDSDCFRFVEGVGVPRDLARARACLERIPWKKACEGGSSADLGLVELALLRIDGIGGSADLAGGRALVGPCADDASKEAVLAHATARERDPKTPAMDFCRDSGGTTLTSDACGGRTLTAGQTRERLQAKQVASTLDETSQKLLMAAEKADDAYVDAMGTDTYEAFIQGTIRGAMATQREIAILATRSDELAAFKGFVAAATSSEQVAAARKQARQCADRATETADEKAALQKTEQAWGAFRDADVALYVSAFGTTQGDDRVNGAVLTRLEARRAGECVIPSLEGK